MVLPAGQSSGRRKYQCHPSPRPERTLGADRTPRLSTSALASLLSLSATTSPAGSTAMPMLASGQRVHHWRIVSGSVVASLSPFQVRGALPTFFCSCPLPHPHWPSSFGQHNGITGSP